MDSIKPGRALMYDLTGIYEPDKLLQALIARIADGKVPMFFLRL